MAVVSEKDFFRDSEFSVSCGLFKIRYRGCFPLLRFYFQSKLRVDSVWNKFLKSDLEILTFYILRKIPGIS